MPETTVYPRSDHYDGERFHNPPGTAPTRLIPGPAGTSPTGTGQRGIMPILRWRFSGERKVWPPQPPDPTPAGDPMAPVPAGAIAVTFIGHSSFLLRLPGITLITDPVFSERCSPVSWAGPRRARPPGRSLAALPRIDLILMSHNHYDHMDLPSLRAIQARDDPDAITPLGNAVHLRKAGLRRIEELDWWQTDVLGDVSVTATPARHFSSRTLWDRGRCLWSGFMIEAGGKRILFAGDSGAGGHWAEIGERLGPIDLALLPIGAYEPRSIMAAVHVNPAEAVEAHLALRSRQSIGMHFGTFQLTDEAIDAPPLALAEATAAASVDPARFVTLGFGETRVFTL